MLTTAQATVLARSVAAFRPSWDDAGIHAAVHRLATDPRPAVVLWQQVVTRACMASSETPEALLWPLDTARPAEAGTPRAPRPDDPLCPVHGGTIVDQLGAFICCRDDFDPQPARSRNGTSRGPSDEQRALIAAACGKSTTGAGRG